jgi:outer membrane protein TolC
LAQSSPRGSDGEQELLDLATGDPDELVDLDEVYELTLDGAWAIALERNLGLQIQELANEAARYNAKGSWGAFEWNLSAQAGVTDQEFENANTLFGESTASQNTQSFSVDLVKQLFTGGTFSTGWSTDNSRTAGQAQRFDTQTSDVFTLSLTQPLLRGFGETFATSVQRESEYEYQRQLEVQRSIRQLLLLDVSNAYWDLVAAREQLSVAISSLDVGEQQAEREKHRLEVGLGTEVDIVQAETQVAQRRERVLFFDFQVRSAMDRLKQLMFPGTNEDLWSLALVPTTPLPAEVTADAAPPWTRAMRTAIENRAELRQQRLLIDSAEVRHARSISDRLSGLDLNLSARSNGFDEVPGDAFSESFSFDFPTYSAFLTYSVPIGNTTARNAEKAAWVNLRSARLNYDQSESDIVAEVRQSVRQLIYQARATAASVQSLELALRQLEVEEARYSEGLSTTFQLLDFQQQLLDAQSSERRARADYARALVALDASLGILGEVVHR